MLEAAAESKASSVNGKRLPLLLLESSSLVAVGVVDAEVSTSRPRFLSVPTAALGSEVRQQFLARAKSVEDLRAAAR